MLLKKKKICKYIIENIEISSDSDRENSDEENSNKENTNEEILMKKTNIKNLIKIFFIIFFQCIKMVNKYQKHKKRL